VTEKPQQHNEVAGLLLFVRIFSTSDTNKKKEKRFVRIKKNGAKESRLKNKNRRGARKHYTKGDG